MEQHPVPQQISSYQFRLVGDMTLKQFFQVSAGFLVALVIYSTHLYGIIKWPLIIFSVLTGIALAFIPFKERPLSVWVLSFFRAIYSPTEFAWKKTEKPKQYFIPEEGEEKEDLAQAKVASEKKSPFLANLEKTEGEFISKISLILKGEEVPVPTTQVSTLHSQPNEPQVASGQPKPQTHIPQNLKTKVVQQNQVPQVQAQQISMPTNQGVSPISMQDVSPAPSPVQFSINAAPPMPTETPNTIVGQVMDPNGRIIEGAILEILDDSGRPVRALKSNKLGHFIIVTQLANGTYRLTTDKEGFKFDELTFDTKGDIIPPIAIKAKSVVRKKPEQKK